MTTFEALTIIFEKRKYHISKIILHDYKVSTDKEMKDFAAKLKERLPVANVAFDTPNADAGTMHIRLPPNLATLQHICLLCSEVYADCFNNNFIVTFKQDINSIRANMIEYDEDYNELHIYARESLL